MIFNIVHIQRVIIIYTKCISGTRLENSSIFFERITAFIITFGLDFVIMAAVQNIPQVGVIDCSTKSDIIANNIAFTQETLYVCFTLFLW